MAVGAQLPDASVLAHGTMCPAARHSQRAVTQAMPQLRRQAAPADARVQRKLPLAIQPHPPA